MSSLTSDAARTRAGDPAIRTTHSVDAHFTRRGTGLEFEMEAQWVRRHLPPGAKRVVDVGCGNGALFEAIGPDRALGIDSCMEGLSLTSRRFSTVPLVAGDAEHLPLRDESLEVITLQHVVEHIPRFDVACTQWRRALKPGGLLLILTPNASFCDPSVFQDPTHVRVFSRRELRRSLERGSFEVIDLRSLGLPWFRDYHHVPWGWRWRRFVISHAQRLSFLPGHRWKGQTLCCLARKPVA